MDKGAKLHLKEWLIVQIESGKYEGLSWEDDRKTMFRIPWKHAAKKDYKQTEDAALFKAWAVYKGKYREGRDKADPTMWKTRLRCALNKSSDFQEVPDRNQLDITEPYKVYRIQYSEGGWTQGPPEPLQTKYPVVNQEVESHQSVYYLEKELQYEEEKEEKIPIDDPMREHMYCHLSETKRQNSSPPSLLSPSFAITDLRMQVKLFYHGGLVTKVTTRSPEGCFILEGRVPVGNERIYGPCSAQQLSLPSPAAVGMPASLATAMSRLLCHLERGVLLWVAPDGVFIKRFCQGRVYWSGPLAPHTDRPNKLDREKTRKLLDVPHFIRALHSCLEGRGHAPSYKIELCFGEEYPDPSVPKNRKLIMAEVVPLFAVELLEKFNLRQDGDDDEEEERQGPINSSEETEMEKD